jgi:LacI family transcriptional regulator, galactose operon repressor
VQPGYPDGGSTELGGADGFAAVSQGRVRASMREVAERAGVAISSVSRVLSGHPDVSETMRRRVLAAVDELDYKPDLLAQGLRSRATRSIGFVAGDISNPLLAQIVRGAEVALREAGYSMLLTNSLVDPELDHHNIELLEQRRADGLIVLLVSENHQPTIDALIDVQVPVVVVERDLPPQVRASRVLSNHRAGMSVAAEHLLDLGHRRIALIGGQDVRPTRERREAVEVEMRRKGLGLDGLRVREGIFAVEHGAAATRELLDLDPPPTALIAGSNQIMIGALQIISERGIELGRDLSFVGCDDVDIATLYRPRISVVDRDRVAIGTVAAEQVLSLVRDPAGPPREVILPTTFISRESVGPVPA